MPKPYKPADKERLSFGPHAMTQRPRLAVHIAIISNLWVRIEDLLADIFAVMLGSNMQAAQTLLDSVIGTHAKLKAVATIAELHLSDDLSALFKGKLSRQIKTNANRRNEIVHGRWGYTDLREDALILYKQYGRFSFWLWTEADFASAEHSLSLLADELLNYKHQSMKYLVENEAASRARRS